MNKTPNYQLNQWDKSDRIRMEDFNADNAKIEAALAQEAAARAATDNSLQSSLSAELQTIRSLLPIVHLQTITTSTTTNKLDIDLSGIDWNTYAFVLVRINGTMSTSSASFYVRINQYSGDRNYYYSTGSSSNSYNHAGYCYLTYGSNKQVPHILLSCQSDKPDISIHNHGVVTRYHGILNASEVVSSLNLVGTADSYTIAAGAKIDIYGIKF